MGAGGEIAGATHRRRRGRGGGRDRTSTRRDHLLAGAAPEFDFSRSDNVAKAEALFPAPARIAEDDGSVAFGYRQRVVFPVNATAADPARPATLRLALDYAVCEKLCLPAHATLALALAPGVTTPYAAGIAAARAQVPARVLPAEIGAQLTAIEARHWRLCFTGAPGAPRELFVEPPQGFWLVAAPSGDCFALDLRDLPPDGKLPIAVTATLVAGAKAFETTVELKAP